MKNQKQFFIRHFHFDQMKLDRLQARMLYEKRKSHFHTAKIGENSKNAV